MVLLRCFYLLFVSTFGNCFADLFLPEDEIKIYKEKINEHEKLMCILYRDHSARLTFAVFPLTFTVILGWFIEGEKK